MAVVRHADHGPDVICRAAGYGLCEPAAEGAVLVDWREALDPESLTRDPAGR